MMPGSSIAQTQNGLDIDGEAADDRSGWSVSLSDDGTILAIGAIFNNGGGMVVVMSGCMSSLRATGRN